MPKRPKISDLATKPKSPGNKDGLLPKTIDPLDAVLDWGDRAERIVRGAGYRVFADEWAELRKWLMKVDSV